MTYASILVFLVWLEDVRGSAVHLLETTSISLRKTAIVHAALAFTLTLAPSMSFGTDPHLQLPFFSESIDGHVLSEDKFLRSRDLIPDHYIVQLDEGVIGMNAVKSEVATTGQFLTSVYGGTVDIVYSSAMKGFAVEMTPEQADKMKLDKSIKTIEQDQIVSATSTETSAPWHLDRIDQRPLPVDTMYSYTSTGTGVNIYIIDSGIRYTHADFGGRADAVYDAINDGQNGNDCYGHGTHIAGIAGSSTYGVAKDSRLHAVRILNCSGQGSIAVTMEGIDRVTSHHVRPAVANLSLTLSGISGSMDTAIANSISSGVTYTIAAGNYGADACNYSPARVPTALTVGASSSDDIRPNFSNYGRCVDLFAPGYNITSLSSGSDMGTAVMSGTSMSAPMVAGAAALYLSSDPTASPATVTDAILHSATNDVLTTNDATSPNRLLYSLISGDTGCSGILYSRRLRRPRQTDYLPSIDGFEGGDGMYTGTLSGPFDADLEMRLEREDKSGWETLLVSTGSKSESISESPGTYRWRVTALRGAGDYTLGSEAPATSR